MLTWKFLELRYLFIFMPKCRNIL